MADFRTVIIQLESIGLTDVIVPFLLIFSVVFSILHLVRLFKKNISIIVATVISLLTVIPHVTKSYPACYDIVSIINSALPKISLAMIGIFMFLLVIGILGLKLSFFDKFLPIIALVALIVVIISFATSKDTTCAMQINLPEMPDLLYYLVPIGLLILVIIFTTGGKTGGGSSGESKPKPKPDPHKYKPY